MSCMNCMSKTTLLVLILIIGFSVKPTLAFGPKERRIRFERTNATLSLVNVTSDINLTTVDTRIRKDLTDVNASDIINSTGVPSQLVDSFAISMPAEISATNDSSTSSLPHLETSTARAETARSANMHSTEYSKLNKFLQEFKVEPFNFTLSTKPRKPLVFREENTLEGIHRNQKIGQVYEREPTNFTNKLEEMRSLFALVGLSLTPYATADYYAASWSQVIHIANPFTDNYVKAGLNTLSNVCYAPVLETAEEKQVIAEIQKQCETGLANGKFSAWSLIETALERVDRGLSRTKSKRAIFALGIIAVLALSAVAGSAYAATAAVENAKRLQRLSQYSNLQDGESIAIREQLIGLSAINEEKLQNVSSHFSLIAGHQWNLKNEINRTNKMLNSILKKQSLTSALFLNLFANVNNQISGLSAYQSVLNEVNRWMDGNIGLRSNRLPVEMVDRDHLRDILSFVASQLPPDLVLALDNIEQYYTLPLVNHVIVKHDIYLKLTIPLRRREVEKQLMLFHVETVGHMCGEACNKVTDWQSDTLIRMNIKPQLWAYDVDRNQFYSSTEYLWSCSPTNEGKHCYSLKREALSIGDNCFKAIQGLSIDEIRDMCEFITATPNDARPISIGNRRFLVTPNLQPFTLKVCDKRYKLSMPAITDFGMLPVAPECRLIYKDEVVLYEDLYTNNTVELAIERPATKLSLHDLRNFTFRLMHIEKMNFSRYMGNVSAIKELTYDNKKLTQIVRQIHLSKEMIAQRLESNLHEYREQKSFSYATMIQIICEILGFVLLYIVVFTAIRSGNFLFLLAPTIVIHSQPGYAQSNETLAGMFESALNATAPPTETIMESDGNWFFNLSLENIIAAYKDATDFLDAYRVEKYLQIAKFSIAFVLALLTVWWSRFRVVHLLNYRGRVGERNMKYRFYIMIDYIMHKQRLTCQTSYKVSILVPIQRDVPADTVALTVVNPLQLWYTKSRLFYWCSAEQIRLRGVDKNGEWTCEIREPLQLSFGSIQWFGDKPTFNLFRTSYGDCRITALPDPHELN
ncbi:hypothetical protein HDE_01809 [Halotydeus destructor]|nr:hypothetical protein HDE_01809 [Halotydeus destructor]